MIHNFTMANIKSGNFFHIISRQLKIKDIQVLNLPIFMSRLGNRNHMPL